jgi:NTE family protein
MIYAINQQKLADCDLMMAPEALENIGVLDRRGMEKAYEIGYESAIQILEEAFNEN